MNAFGLTLPALRGKQGDRVFYQCMVPNSVLNNFFPVNMEPEADKSQRTIDPKHAQDIGDYIVDNADTYLLGSITYAMDTLGTFRPSEVDENIGVLTIPIEANMRSLDGQHRRVGLKNAIDEDPDIAFDNTSILIYVEPELIKRRQMFSDMNATPKIVAKALNVSFDTRDPFARAAVTLSERHPLLMGHVEMQGTRVRALSTSYFSLAGIYDALKRVRLGAVLPRGRQPKQDVADLETLGSKFFDLLSASRPEFKIAATLAPEEMRTYREKSILFSTTTLRAIAGAIHICMSTTETEDPRAFESGLAAVNFEPSAELFRKTGFVSPGKTTPNARNQEVQAATDALSEAILKAN